MKRILVLAAMLGMFLPLAVGCEKKAEKAATPPAENAPATPAENPPAEPAK